MLSPRFLLSAALALFGSVGVLAVPKPSDFVGTAPNTPVNEVVFTTNYNVAMCLMEKLEWSTFDLAGKETSAVELLQINRPDGEFHTGFLQNHFTYSCTCDADMIKAVIHPTMVEKASSAEITFNGKVINARNKANAISNKGTATTLGQFWSPRTTEVGSDDLFFNVGTNLIVIGVGCNGNANPNCYYEYTIKCTKPDTEQRVEGDPQFVGLRGQSYQVHGVAGEVYNIVSDADLQYNSRFVFLSSGACPVVGGIRQKACYSHPGSYLGELGLKTRAGDRIQVVSGSASEGFASVSINGAELELGQSVLLADSLGSISRNSTHKTEVAVGNWDFVFENSDMFINQRVRVLDARTLRSHGLLGQTWREVTYPNAVKHIQGAVDDYVIRSADVFGDDFVFNAFN